MLTVNYDALPPEVATFRDYLTIAVQYPNRGDLIKQLSADLKIMEDYLSINRGPETCALLDYYTRTVSVLTFIEAYVKDDGSADGFVSIN